MRGRSGRRLLASAVLVVLAALVVDISAATAELIAYFDLRRVIAESKLVKKLEAGFETRVAVKRKELGEKQEALKAAMAERKGQPPSNPQLIQDVAALRKELNEVKGVHEKTVREAVQAAVATVAKQKGYTLVLDKSLVFHGAPTADATALVLERLDAMTPP